MDNVAEQVESFFVYFNSDEVKNCVTGINTVRGGLAKSLCYWRDTLNSSEFVLSIVREGYRIPLNFIPPTCNLTNNKSARDQPELVSDAILKLLDGGYVIECRTPPHCVNPLTVAKDKELILVLDLRHVNKHIRTQSFRYEDIKSLPHLFAEKYWFFTWDLKSGYHHVGIYPPHRQFLGFSWIFSGKKTLFCICRVAVRVKFGVLLFHQVITPLN